MFEVMLSYLLVDELLYLMLSQTLVQMYGSSVADSLDIAMRTGDASTVSKEEQDRILRAYSGITTISEDLAADFKSKGISFTSDYMFNEPDATNELGLQYKTVKELLDWSSGIKDGIHGLHPGPDPSDPNKKKPDKWQKVIAGSSAALAEKADDILKNVTRFLSMHRSGINTLTDEGYRLLVRLGSIASNVMSQLEALTSETRFGPEAVQVVRTAAETLRGAVLEISSSGRLLELHVNKVGSYTGFVKDTNLAIRQIYTQVLNAITNLR